MEDKENWKFPKFYNMRKYETLIPLYGNVEQLSSAPGERSNADSKAHGACSNRHSTMIDQVLLCPAACCCHAHPSFTRWALSQPAADATFAIRR